jgi:hypothetical protein
MASLGPAAAILVSFIGAISAVLAVYGATGLKSRDESPDRHFPSLG